MAETRTIALKQIPSRRLQKRVKAFIKDNDVSVLDTQGRTYRVRLERNNLVLHQTGSEGTQSDGGCVPSLCPIM